MSLRPWRGRLRFGSDDPDNWEVVFDASATGSTGKGTSAAVVQEIDAVGRLPLLDEMKFEDYVSVDQFARLARNLQWAFSFFLRCDDERFWEALNFWSGAGQVPQSDLATLPVCVFLTTFGVAKQHLPGFASVDVPEEGLAVGVALYTTRNLAGEAKRTAG